MQHECQYSRLFRSWGRREKVRYQSDVRN
jgi:hypothetical protein